MPVKRRYHHQNTSSVDAASAAKRQADEAKKFASFIEKERSRAIELMVRYGYRLTSSPAELKFELERHPLVPTMYRKVQLRDPAKISEGSNGPVPCLIAEVSQPDNCAFYSLLDRAVSKER